MHKILFSVQKKRIGTDLSEVFHSITYIGCSAGISGVAMVPGVRHKERQSPPVTEVMNLKGNHNISVNSFLFHLII